MRSGGFACIAVRRQSNLATRFMAERKEIAPGRVFWLDSCYGLCFRPSLSHTRCSHDWPSVRFEETAWSFAALDSEVLMILPNLPTVAPGAVQIWYGDTPPWPTIFWSFWLCIIVIRMLVCFMLLIPLLVKIKIFLISKLSSFMFNNAHNVPTY